MSAYYSNILAHRWASHCVSWWSRFLCCLSSHNRTRNRMQLRSYSGLMPLRESKMTLVASPRRIRNSSTLRNSIALLKWCRSYVRMLSGTKLKATWMELAYQSCYGNISIVRVQEKKNRCWTWCKQARIYFYVGKGLCQLVHTMIHFCLPSRSLQQQEQELATA